MSIETHSRAHDSKPKSNNRANPNGLVIPVFPEFDAIPVIADYSARLEYIIELMQNLQWETGRSGKILAKRWNTAPSNLRKLAAEASRVIRADRDPVAVNITEGAIRLFNHCLTLGDAKGAAAIGKLLADVSGANAPIQQEIRVDSELDPAKARALTNKLFAGGVGDSSKTHEDSDIASIPEEPDSSSDDEIPL